LVESRVKTRRTTAAQFPYRARRPGPAADAVRPDQALRQVTLATRCSPGVAKASLYDILGSKEELVRAYLEGRPAGTSERTSRALRRFRAPANGCSASSTPKASSSPIPRSTGAHS
jgi:AcrR family transcriptional regulator